MSPILHWLKRNYKPVLLSLLFFAAFIAFEARQQLFYAQNFNTGPELEVGFVYFLRNGFYRWLIWIALAIPMGLLMVRSKMMVINARTVTIYGSLVAITLALNLVVITLVQLDGGYSFAAFKEVFEFYFFHKAPIILAALVFLVLLIQYFMNLEALQVTVQELGSLKYTNEQLYEQQKSTPLQDEDMVIQVKVGNRIRLVSVNSIVWIEADDYCVKIHDEEGRSHTMRSSMKAFEEKLPAERFARVHRKAIVNLSRISEYNFGASPKLILEGGIEVPMAQARVKEIRQLFQPA